MMLYNGAKKTFYLLILCINITKKTLFLAYKILIFDACQSLTAKYTTNYNYINPCISNWEDRALFFFISFLAISYQRIELVICMYVCMYFLTQLVRLNAIIFTFQGYSEIGSKVIQIVSDGVSRL